jgi:hypothetical protein
MSKASMMGRFTCQDGKADESELVRNAMVEAAGDEPGVEVHSHHHGRSEAMQTAMAAFGPLVAAPPQMTMTMPVAAIGLDL